LKKGNKKRQEETTKASFTYITIGWQQTKIGAISTIQVSVPCTSKM